MLIESRHRCANCGASAGWWDGNCVAFLCTPCVPVMDEYVVAEHEIRVGAKSRSTRPRPAGTPSRLPARPPC